MKFHFLEFYILKYKKKSWDQAESTPLQYLIERSKQTRWVKVSEWCNLFNKLTKILYYESYIKKRSVEGISPWCNG